MIRLNQRKLIIPRGDTGEFSVPLLSSFTDGDIAVFAIFNTINRTIVFSKQVPIQDGKVTVSLNHNQTVNLPAGKYTWDIKLYNQPQYLDEVLVNGNQISSYNAGFVNFPICQIVETADNYLMADDAPTSTLAPAQLDIITAAIEAMNTAVEKTEENITHCPILVNQVWFVWDTDNGEYISTGVHASPITDSQLSNISEHPVQNKVITAALAGKANNNDIPVNVSELQNDTGYLVAQDIVGKQDILTFDNTPILNSTNPVTSNGIKTALDLKMNSSQLDTILLDYFTESNVTTIENVQQIIQNWEV